MTNKKPLSECFECGVCKETFAKCKCSNIKRNIMAKRGIEDKPLIEKQGIINYDENGKPIYAVKSKDIKEAVEELKKDIKLNWDYYQHTKMREHRLTEMLNKIDNIFGEFKDDK